MAVWGWPCAIRATNATSERGLEAAAIHPSGMIGRLDARESAEGVLYKRCAWPSPNGCAMADDQTMQKLKCLRKRKDEVSSPALRWKNQRYMDVFRHAMENADGGTSIFSWHVKEEKAAEQG